jgi:predicted DNA-binding transcriptional regulator YafY
MNRKNGEEKVKLSRIARIDEEIRAGTYPNSEELAKKLEVSPRTILRDIDFLRYSYDAPIEYDFNKRGFYYTEPNFFIRSVMLTKEELETITIYDQFSKLSSRDDDDFALKFRNIIDKLLMVLPEDISNSLPFSPTPKVQDFIFNPNIQIDGDIIHTIHTAIENKEIIGIEYWISDNRKFIDIDIEPLYIFFQRHCYYLLAWKNDKHDKPEIYSINRIRKVNATGKHFDIQVDFKVSAYLKEKTDVTPSDNKLYHFEFSFPKEIASEAIEKTYYHNQVIKQCKDGTVLVTFRSTQLYEVFYWVLSEGHKVKVLNPPELVKMVKREAQKVVQYYL